MAFIRERIIKGKDGVSKHYQILESYWQDGRSKKRVIENLGKQFSVEKALDEAERRGFGSILGSKPGFQPGVKESEIEKPGVKESLPQLSPAGNLTRRERLLVKKVPGPGPYDLLPPPGEGEEWGKRYFKRITFGLMERKIKGVDPREIAGILFPHFPHNQQVNLAAATLVHRLLTERLDKSVDPGRFIDEYRASDYKSVVSQIKRRGEQNGSSKLVEADVIEIRRRYIEGGTTYKGLGDEYGVRTETIYKIISGKTWKHVSFERGKGNEAKESFDRSG